MGTERDFGEIPTKFNEPWRSKAPRGLMDYATAAMPLASNNGLLHRDLSAP